MYQENTHQKSRSSLPEYISVISSNSCAKIRIDDIEIVEQDGRKLHIVTEGRDYTFYGSLSGLAETLAGRAFFRPIKSIIINLDHVKDISGYSVNFNSGQSLAMGKNALSSTKRAYKRYLQKYPPYSTWEPMISVEELVAGAVAEAAAEFESFGSAMPELMEA